MGWIDDANASVVQAWAAIAQAFLGGAILIATGVYAWLTHRIARGTHALAVAADRQRFGTVLPVVVFSVNLDSSGGIAVTNVGLGPALDVTAALEDCPLKFVPMRRQQIHAPLHHGFVLRPGESVYFGLDWVAEPVQRVEILGRLTAKYRDAFGRILVGEATFNQPVGVSGLENLIIGGTIQTEPSIL